MLNGYHYTGPLPLGSVVAHSCGAAGLFSRNEAADVILRAVERDDMYVLTVSIRGVEHTLTGPVSSMGRRSIGQSLLVLLRTEQGLPAHNEWGTMVGVRPTKLIVFLMNPGYFRQNHLNQCCYKKYSRPCL